MLTIPKLIGKPIYGPSKCGKSVQVNIDINEMRDLRVVNLTCYAYVDQKYKFARSILEHSFNRTVITDTDYVGFDEMIELLLKNKHTVCFVLAPREWSVQRMGDRTNTVFGGAPASNARIRKAFNKLKAAGVKVKKFQNPMALQRYLQKQKGA